MTTLCAAEVELLKNMRHDHQKKSDLTNCLAYVEQVKVGEKDYFPKGNTQFSFF